VKIERDKNYGQKTKESLIWSTTLQAAFQVFRVTTATIKARILDSRDFGIMGMAILTIS
jgi:hypothetical protein